MTPATKLTRAAIRAVIDTLAAKQYGLAPGEPRVVGIRDAPAAELEDEFPHTVAGRPTTVHVVPCVSALAAYEALVDRDPDAWLVLVTDRSEEDLGEGVRARLIGQRLRLIDPWLGVRTAFGATGVDRSLTRLPQDREVANGLLTLISRTDTPWPAAPAGLLTLDHVAGAIAGRELGLTGNGIDGIAVLSWLARPGAMARLGELRRTGGDAVADTLVDWLAGRAPAAKDLVAAHLREGRPRVLLPLGIATQVLRDTRARDPEAAAAWERFRTDAPAPLARPEVAEELGTIATTVVDDLLQARDGWLLAEAALVEADRLLAAAGAAEHAAASPLLPSGLAARFTAVAEALRGDGDPGAAWAYLTAHSLIQHATRPAARGVRSHPGRPPPHPLARHRTGPRHDTGPLPDIGRRQPTPGRRPRLGRFGHPRRRRRGH